MSSDREDDFDRGVRNRRAVLGDEWVDRALGGADTFNAEFQALITRHAWHDIWSRPGLDHSTRRLLVLAMTMAQGRWEEFELHCRAAVRSGHGLATLVVRADVSGGGDLVSSNNTAADTAVVTPLLDDANPRALGAVFDETHTVV